MSADTPSLADLTGMKLLPHQQEIIDFITSNEVEIIPKLIANMGRVNRSFGKLGQRASTAAEAARNFNAALQGVNMTYRSYNAETQRAERETGNRLRKAEHKRRVAQTYRRTTRAERRTEHAIRMNMRQKRNAEIETGFEPTANRKVTAMYQQIMASLVMMNEKRVIPMTPLQIQQEAFAELRNRLPKTPMGVRTAPFVQPSKSDDAAYRRGGNFNKATGQPIRQLEAA